jgi:hypothetical protein
VHPTKDEAMSNQESKQTGNGDEQNAVGFSLTKSFTDN